MRCWRRMNREFDAVYARRDRRCRRRCCSRPAAANPVLHPQRTPAGRAVNYNLLYRWFVGLNIEDKVWDHSTFSANRERLFNEDLARAFFERVKLTAQWAGCQRRTLQRGRHADRGLGLAQSSRVSNAGRRQTRHPDATPRWTSKGRSAATAPTPAPPTPMPAVQEEPGDKSRLCHMGHILMENRNGLIVDVEITHASGTAEREAALAMLNAGATRTSGPRSGRQGLRQQGLHQGLSPAQGHAARGGQDKHSGGRCASPATRATRPASKCASASRRPLAGSRPWGLAKTKLIGQAKLTGQALLCFATYNLVRMGSIGGWWDAHHA